MDVDKPSQEGCEDVPSELSFLVAAPAADPMPVVTRSSEGTRPEPTSSMVTRSRAREGREISVAPEVPSEPEIEMRPEPEIAACEGSLGATRSYPTDTALFTFAEIVTAYASQEVTETGLISHTASQTSRSHKSTRGCYFTHLSTPLRGHRILHMESESGHNQTCQVSAESLQEFRSPGAENNSSMDLAHRPYNTVCPNVRH